MTNIKDQSFEESQWKLLSMCSRLKQARAQPLYKVLQARGGWNLILYCSNLGTCSVSVQHLLAPGRKHAASSN